MARPIDDIAAAIRDAIIDALKDREDELKAIAEAGGSKAAGGIFSDVGKLTDVISTLIEIGLLLDPPGEAAFQLLKAGEDAGGHLGGGFGIGYLVGYAGFQMLEPALMPLSQKIATIFQTQQLDPGVVATMVAQRVLAQQDGRNKAHEMNVSDDNFDLMAEAARTWPDMVTLLTMRDRSLITDDMLLEGLQRHGYPDTCIDPIKGLSRQLLSPADLALASLRGILTEDVARAYAHILSITDADFDVLIANTGEPPGLMQLLEAFRRGFIDQDRLERGIRQSRVRDEWIDVVEALRFSPMSVSDAIRAVVEHYLTEDEGKAIAIQNGLLPEHWEPMMQSWGRPLSHDQMMKLVHLGLATQDDFTQAMRESDIKDKYIQWSFELGRTLIAERQIVSMIQHEVVTHDEGVTLLMQQGYNAEDADRVIRLGAAQRSTSHKTLSKTDILAMYTDALMNRAQAVDDLKALGYSESDAGMMLDLADYKAKAQRLKLVQRGIQASLAAHHITENEALAQLTTAGLDHAQAQILVDEWLQLRSTPTRTLTEAQTLKAVEDLVITPDDGRVRLRALGLADADIDILYKVNGIMPYDPAWHYPTTPSTPAVPSTTPPATPPPTTGA